MVKPNRNDSSGDFLFVWFELPPHALWYGLSEMFGPGIACLNCRHMLYGGNFL
ncbi:hypothetical protein [Methanolapillus ohkumae]|uniref:hypothetical protein n=1 Tax=Methanolapillus ohkumae TaxID=3028298 RepID=UPI0030B8EDB1